MIAATGLFLARSVSSTSFDAIEIEHDCLPGGFLKHAGRSGIVLPDPAGRMMTFMQR